MTEGKCFFCGETFKKISMKKHLDRCTQKTKEYLIGEGEASKPYFCILVQGYYDPNYWMYVDMPINSTLKILDSFLRDIWLECCGHLSAFIIGGQSYSVLPDEEFDDLGMNYKMYDVLDVGSQFKYEYDFGSTTTLKLKIVAEYNAKRRRNSVNLLARNEDPFIPCDKCGEKAVYVCCECMHDSDAWFCEECVKTHECDEDMLLPVVNSPRSGVCAYCG